MKLRGRAANAPQDRHAAPESLRRSALFAGAVQLAGTVFTAILTLYLVRALPRAEYGEFAIALAVGAVVVLPSDFGVSSSAARYLAESFGDSSRSLRVISTALKLKAFISVFVGSAIFVAAEPIAHAYGHPALVAPLRLIAIAVTAQTIFGLTLSLFTALRRMRTVFSIATAESAAEMSATILLVSLGGGVIGATLGRALGYTLGAAFGILLLARHQGGLGIIRTPFQRRLGASIARYAGAVAVVDAIWAMLSQLDVLIMGAILSVPAVAAFQAPARLLSLATYPGMALANAFGPSVADRTDMARTSAALASAVRRLLLVQGFAAAVVAAYADVIVHLALGQRYVGTSAESVLRVMSPFVLLSGLAPLFSTTIDYLGGARRRIPIAAATLFVNVTINLLLLRRIGPVAAAIAVDAGYFVFVFGHAFVATRLLGLDLRSIGRTLGAVAVAATLMTATVELIRALSGGVLVAIVAGIAGSGLFAAAVVVSRQHRVLLNGRG